MRALNAATRDAVRVMLFAVNAVLLGLLAYFSWTTVPSSDDYWYATFWDKGLKHYLEMMDYHYQHFNGRSQVHILAHAILHFENWAFVLSCCTLCMGAILAVCAAVRVGRERIPVLTALFLAGLLMMPTSLFAQGMMWISAFCNYLYPVTLLCLLILVYERSRSGWLLSGMAFLCGATTEQMGLVSLAVTAVYAVDGWIRKRNGIRRLLAVGCAGAGLLTVFLSPATQRRAMSNVHFGELLRIITEWLETAGVEAGLLTENGMPLLMMLAFLLLAAYFLWSRWNRWAIGAVGTVGIAGLALWQFGQEWGRIWGSVAVFAALTFLAVVLIIHEERVPGVLMLAALVSCAVILPVDAVGPRLMVPFYVQAVLSVCMLWHRCAERRPVNSTVLLVLLAVVVGCLLPAIRGYWHNYEIGRMNKAFIEDDRGSDVLRYRADFDYDYTWIGKAHTNTSYAKYYIESAGLPEEMSLFAFSGEHELHGILCNGERLASFAVTDQAGDAWFPLRKVTECLDGVLEWTMEGTTLDFGGIRYGIQFTEDETVLTWEDETGAQRELRTGCLKYAGVSFCDARFLQEILGLSSVYEAEEDLWVLTSARAE